MCLCGEHKHTRTRTQERPDPFELDEDEKENKHNAPQPMDDKEDEEPKKEEKKEKKGGKQKVQSTEYDGKKVLNAICDCGSNHFRIALNDDCVPESVFCWNCDTLMTIRVE